MSPNKLSGKSVDPNAVWREWFSSNAFRVDKSMRRFNRMLPHHPRCKFCNAPFEGVGARVVKVLFGKQRSELNPYFCNLCDQAARKFLGGAEVEMSMLFADVRESTALSEKMSISDFSRLISRFYIDSTRIITEEDGLVDKLAGDAVAAFWGPGFAGPQFIQRTIKAARKLSAILARQKIPVGIGVHAGVAFFGAVGSKEGLTDISALGDEVNTAARIASKAAAGEILVSEQALAKAHVESSQFELRSLDLKGLSETVQVRVLHASSVSLL